MEIGDCKDGISLTEKDHFEFFNHSGLLPETSAPDHPIGPIVGIIAQNVVSSL